MKNSIAWEAVTAGKSENSLAPTGGKSENSLAWEASTGGKSERSTHWKDPRGGNLAPLTDRNKPAVWAATPREAG